MFTYTSAPLLPWLSSPFLAHLLLSFLTPSFNTSSLMATRLDLIFKVRLIFIVMAYAVLKMAASQPHQTAESNCGRTRWSDCYVWGCNCSKICQYTSVPRCGSWWNTLHGWCGHTSLLAFKFGGGNGLTGWLPTLFDFIIVFRPYICRWVVLPQH